MLGLVNNQHHALCSLNISGMKGGGGGRAPAGPSVAPPVPTNKEFIAYMICGY
jgi:hypothetical protein